MMSHLGRTKSSDNDTLSRCSSVDHHGRACSSHSGDEEGFGSVGRQYGGHWFTLRDLELATNRFAAENVIGEGGYGVVYRGKLVNGTEFAVKKLLNNLFMKDGVLVEGL